MGQNENFRPNKGELFLNIVLNPYLVVLNPYLVVLNPYFVKL